MSNQMEFLHPWDVDEREAFEIQESLKDRILLEKTFKKVDAIGGADVAYAKKGEHLLGAMVILSFPDLETIDMAVAEGQTSFPYIPSLLSFREGPILLKTFSQLRIKPDVMIFDGHGTAHPRRFGLASHLGLWLNLPSIGCAKTPLSIHYPTPGGLKGSYEVIQKEGKAVGVVLRTKENVKPLFISPGHRIDLFTSIQLVLACCRRFRIPEPLRHAHQLAKSIGHSAERKIHQSKTL